MWVFLWKVWFQWFLTLQHRISNLKSLISLQPTKAFMRLFWCVSGMWGWEVITTAHKVILAATSPSQMGNIAFILRGAAPQIWISQKWCVTHLGAKNPRLGWDIRRRVPVQHHRHLAKLCRKFSFFPFSLLDEFFTISSSYDAPTQNWNEKRKFAITSNLNVDSFPMNRIHPYFVVFNYFWGNLWSNEKRSGPW